MAFLPPGIQYTGPRLIQECSPEELHRRRQAKYDELWGEPMGDQLAKGWADSSAKPQVSTSTHVQYITGMDLWFADQRRIYGLQREAEVQAEEDLLP